MSDIAKRDTGQELTQRVELLTPEDVARRLAEIHAVQGDPEAAHALTDDLYRAVLFSVAAGSPDSAVLAAAALRAETLGFARWCA